MLNELAQSTYVVSLTRDNVGLLCFVKVESFGK